MSPRSSNAVSSRSTGSAGVPCQFCVGYFQPTTVGAVVSAVVGSRCVMARLTSSLRVVSVTCSRPKPNVTVSRVERIAPPLAVWAGVVV